MTELKNGVRILSYEGMELDVYDNLKNIGEGGYIRKTTKEFLYEDIYYSEPEVWDELVKRSWFRNDYQELIDKVNVIVEEKQVETVVSLGSVFEDKLVEYVIGSSVDRVSKSVRNGLIDDLNNYIKEEYGNIPQVHRFEMNDEVMGEVTGVVHEKMDDILKLVKLNIPIMLVGPAGTGKNHTLLQVSELLGMSFYYSSSVTQEHKITGFIDANGHYHGTEFHQAFTTGGIYMLDELDASIPEVLVLLNGAIANGYFDFPNGREFAHEDFRIVTAGNTFGTGADRVYTGRNVIDGATLDRFAVIEMGYSSEVEDALCPDTDYLKIVRTMRKIVESESMPFIVSMRALINGYKVLSQGMSKRFVIESILFKGMDVDSVKIVVDRMAKENIDWDWENELDKYRDEVA